MPSKITMKAAVVEKFGEPLVLREVPIPTPGQALVEVFATGVCHTDLRAADGDWPIKPKPPFIPGQTAILLTVPNRTDIENRSHYKYV